ncbi:MAG: hypothetical protein E6J91_05565 [Deltaproteobacteria bacterium]|nr:MAG: hypothetical protein E6J91_05565 [Deltaproteobacteria bacterium]
MLIQEKLIAKIRELCVADERLDAALMYGSFASGEADEHSDVEFWLFFEPGHRAEIDPRSWCAQIGPLLHHVRNEWGADVVMLPGLVRGDLRFATTEDIAGLRSWPARGAPVERMIVLDRTGPEVSAGIWSAWGCGKRLWTELLQRHGREVPRQLFAELDEALSP